MPGWFGWLLAVVSTVGFLSLWFWEVRLVLRNYRSMVQCAAGQLVSCRKRLAQSQQDAALLEVLRRSESIYRQAAEHYNAALCKPWAYFPGRLLGFRKAPADIPIPPEAECGGSEKKGKTA